MEKFYLAALTAVLGTASRKTLKLLNRYGDARAAYEVSAEELKANGFLTQVQYKYYQTVWQKDLPEIIAEQCQRLNVDIVTYRASNYPLSLRNMGNAPVLLYVRGHLPPNKNWLAVVGSRKATAYGLQVAEDLSERLAQAGVVIVSGGALGIDAAAHRGAVKAHKPTVAVLGTGVDYYYPRQNARLFDEIIHNGAIVSEFPFGTKALTQHFPMRNRIIVGLSRAVAVIEAALKSGAMITADLALEQGKEIFCVPGSIYSFTSKGTNSLLKDGAALLDRPEDILLAFKMLGTVKETKQKIEHPDLFAVLPQQEAGQAAVVLDALSYNQAITLEEVLVATNLPLAEVSGILLNLQIGGLIREQAGQRYTRI